MAGADYMIVQQIYGGFGPVGAVLEPGAIVSATALPFLLRGRLFLAFLSLVVSVLLDIPARASVAEAESVVGERVA